MFGSTGGNVCLALEILYCLMLTPSMTGYAIGMEEALAEVDTNDNLFFRFVRCTKTLFGSVGGGGHTRRQVSSGRGTTKANILQSLINLLKIIEFANTTDDTTIVIAKMTSGVGSGGLYGVGNLIAHEMLHILVITGIVTNRIHVTNTQISRGTATYARLVNLGIRSATHQALLLDWMERLLNLPRQVCENVICETLRDGREVYDTIDTHGRLYGYNYTTGELKVYRMSGRVDNQYPIPQWRMPTADEEYQGERWFMDGYTTSNVDGEFVFFSNRV